MCFLFKNWWRNSAMILIGRKWCPAHIIHFLLDVLIFICFILFIFCIVLLTRRQKPVSEVTSIQSSSGWRFWYKINIVLSLGYHDTPSSYQMDHGPGVPLLEASVHMWWGIFFFAPSEVNSRNLNRRTVNIKISSSSMTLEHTKSKHKVQKCPWRAFELKSF